MQPSDFTFLMKSTGDGRFRIFLISVPSKIPLLNSTSVYFAHFSFSLCFQVIVEKAPKARIGDLDKKKYLVPSDLTGKRSFKSSVLFH